MAVLFSLLLCASASAAKVTVPKGVKSIAAETFYKDKSVTEVYLPDSVTKIGPRAFADSGLKKIRLSSGLKSIDPTAFDGIAFLEVEVKAGTWADAWWEENRIYYGHFPWEEDYQYTVLDNGTIRIDQYIGPGDLMDVLIPRAINGKRVTEIGAQAFLNCSGLTGTPVIPDSVVTIGKFAFRGCKGFTGSLTIPDSVTSLGEGAFYSCQGFTGSLVLSRSLTGIEKFTFSDCRFTGTLTIPSGVMSIGKNAFDHNDFTGSLIIPDNVTSIGYAAFSGCRKLTSLKVPACVASIDDLAFSDSDNLETVYAAENSVAWQWFKDNGFEDKRSAIWDHYWITLLDNGTIRLDSYYGPTDAVNVVIPKKISGKTVTVIGEHVFVGLSGLTGDLTIPDSVTSIEYRAFYYCTGFNGSLTLGNNVISIGEEAFQNCHGFTGSLVIPSSVTSIGGGAFQNCWGFTGSLVIPSGVTSIGQMAFDTCIGLTSLTVPASVTSIGSSAFYNSDNLRTVYAVRNSTAWQWFWDNGFRDKLRAL